MAKLDGKTINKIKEGKEVSHPTKREYNKEVLSHKYPKEIENIVKEYEDQSGKTAITERKVAKNEVKREREKNEVYGAKRRRAEQKRQQQNSLSNLMAEHYKAVDEFYNNELQPEL